VVVILTGWVGDTVKLQGGSEEGRRFISVSSK
jgi:hypothetical protein